MTSWWRPWAALALLPILTTCSGVGGSDTTVCPPIVIYSGEFQIRLADELAKLPDGSALSEAMRDYAVERAQLRACAGS